VRAVAAKPATIDVVHGIGANAGLAHGTRWRDGTTTFAVTSGRAPLSVTVVANDPSTSVRAVPICLLPARMRIVLPAMPLPASVSRPETLERLAPAAFAASVSVCGVACSASASAAAAALRPRSSGRVRRRLQVPGVCPRAR